MLQKRTLNDCHSEGKVIPPACSCFELAKETTALNSLLKGRKKLCLLLGRIEQGLLFFQKTFPVVMLQLPF